jgi:hypothetical protein
VVCCRFRENFHVDEHYAAMTPGLQRAASCSIKWSDTWDWIRPHDLDKDLWYSSSPPKGVGTGQASAFHVARHRARNTAAR